MTTSSSSSLTSQMLLASFLGLPTIQFFDRLLLLLVSNDCRKAWKGGEYAGNVSVDHFQYHKGFSDSSDIFVCTQNTVVQKLYCQTIRR